MRTGVLTHGWTTKQSEKLIRLGLVDYFGPRDVFISDQVGISKPNPKLYTRACARFSLPPSEVMYCGDHPLHDIDPPNDIGMITTRMRRGNRWNDVESATPADYDVTSFDELLPRLVEDFGRAEAYGWSEDKARQSAKPERADFGAYVRRRGFALD